MGEPEYSAKEYMDKAIDIALKNKEKGMKKMSLIFEEECMKVAGELFKVKDEISYKVCVAHVMALLDFYKRLMQKGKRMMFVDMYELDKKENTNE